MSILKFIKRKLGIKNKKGELREDKLKSPEDLMRVMNQMTAHAYMLGLYETEDCPFNDKDLNWRYIPYSYNKDHTLRVLKTIQY